MADGDADAQDGAPSGDPAGHRSRRLLWAGLGVLLLGVGVGVGVVLALGGDDDGTPKVAAGETELVTTSKGATTTTATTTTSAPSAPSGTAAPAGGGGTRGGGSPPTSPPAAPATVTPPPTTAAPPPTVVSASAEPNFVVCPKFGGTTIVTISWNTANADGVTVAFVGVDGEQSGQGGAAVAQGSDSYPIPCNGKQQKLVFVPGRANPDGGDAIRGPEFAVFVNEGIEGT